MSNTCRIGVGGPVGSGKTALIEAITPYFLKLGLQVLIITNDIVTTEDAKHVRNVERLSGRRTDYRCRDRCLSPYGRTGRPFDEYCRCRGNGN